MRAQKTRLTLIVRTDCHSFSGIYKASACDDGVLVLAIARFVPVRGLGIYKCKKATCGGRPPFECAENVLNLSPIQSL